MFSRILLFLIGTIVLVSCYRPDQDLRLAVYVEGSSSELAGKAIQKALLDEGWNITLVNMTHAEAISSLQKGEIDLAIASNEISLESEGLRTIIPLYTETLFTLVRKDSEYASSGSIEESRELLKKFRAKVMFSYKDSYAQKFARRLLENEGFYDNDYDTYYYKPGEDYRQIDYVELDSIQPDVIYHMGTSNSAIIFSVANHLLSSS